MKTRFTLLCLFPLLALGAIFTLWRYLWSVVANPHKAWCIAIAIDDAANMGANGRLGQTISSRAAYAQKAGRTWGCVLCKLLDTVSPGHCQHAITDKYQNL